jgi:hypothetical protein
MEFSVAAVLVLNVYVYDREVVVLVNDKSIVIELYKCP